MNKATPIETEHGEIHGRDGIYLDMLIQSFSPSSLQFRGDISRHQCTNTKIKKNWIGYILTFQDVEAFDCKALDIYSENRITSSFDELFESQWLIDLKLEGFHHYILATYDYVYEIAARGYVLNSTGVDRD